mmetsp:Transcript_2126/g.2970  ORF Transcript_2126/g.2970 Transcript_2126/m.2970 type:complete len:98 (-) Transcript_2126:41-334(-)
MFGSRRDAMVARRSLGGRVGESDDEESRRELIVDNELEATYDRDPFTSWEAKRSSNHPCTSLPKGKSPAQKSTKPKSSVELRPESSRTSKRIMDRGA